MKILFIRFSSIGDIVLTTPVVRCVKEQVKDVEIHFLLKKSYAPVLENNPYIDKLFFYEDDLHQTAVALEEQNYDLIIDLQKNFRSFRLRQLLGIKTFTFDKLNFQKWLLVNFKIDRLPKVHIVDRYMNSVKSLGVANDGRGLDYFVTADDEKVSESLPETYRSGYIAWVIGARHATKRLPFEKMISIGRKISTPIVLLGDKNDSQTGKLLADELGKKVFNACGIFSLNQSAALVKHAQKVITNDTGLMHIAAAFQKQIISIWGNTVPEFGMYPYFGEGVQSIKYKVQSSDSVMLEVKNLSCRPCSKIGFEKCPKKHFRCMNDIDETVFN